MYTRSVTRISSRSIVWVGAALLPRLGLCGCTSAGFGKCAACAGLTSRCSLKRSPYSVHPLTRLGGHLARILRQHTSFLRYHARILKPIARILRQLANVLNARALITDAIETKKPLFRILLLLKKG